MNGAAYGYTSALLRVTTIRTNALHYLFFFLWRFLRNLFLRLCVAILCLLRFLPQGIVWPFFGEQIYFLMRHDWIEM